MEYHVLPTVLQWTGQHQGSCFDWPCRKRLQKPWDLEIFYQNWIVLHCFSSLFSSTFTTGRCKCIHTSIEWPKKRVAMRLCFFFWIKCWVQTALYEVACWSALQYEMHCPFKFIQFSCNLALGCFFSTRFSIPLLH